VNLAAERQRCCTLIAQRAPRILASGRIERGDRDYFLTALLQEATLDAAERAGVQPVIARRRAGLLLVEAS